MWGSEPAVVNSSSVDRIELGLRQKIESLVGFIDEPSKAIEKAFKKFDKNGSGKLTLQEFLTGMNALNFQGFDKDCEALFRRYDLDKSGTLDFKEFGSALFNTGDKILRATSTIGKLREAMTLRAGGYLELKDMARQFKILDKDGNGTLSKDEFRDGFTKFLRTFNFEIKRPEFERLFAAFDKDGDGSITYQEFLRGLRGDMNERREKLVRLAFDFLDADKSGAITLDEVKLKYNAKNHPKVKEGKWTEEQALKEFLSAWNRDGDDKVDWEEFLDHYQWISPLIDFDDYFELMIRNAFHLSGGEGWSANTTCRRVLVFHKDGRQTVEEIKNDFGIGKDDIPKMIQNLKEQGFDPVKIELNF